MFAKSFVKVVKKKHVVTNKNPYLGKTHELRNGRSVNDISHSWAKHLDEELCRILAASPELRYVSIRLPKQDRDVLRLFHSDEGLVWKQVHLANFRSRRYDIHRIVRGAQELDGDPAFGTELTVDNLERREAAGCMLLHKDRYDNKIAEYETLQAWAEQRIRPILDYAGELYVQGAGSEEARKGRQQALKTINRLIQHLRRILRNNEEFKFPERSAHSSGIECGLREFILRRYWPFPGGVSYFYYNFENMTKKDKHRFAKNIWANVARMPENSRFDVIYGALLRQAKGHLIDGDKYYRRLEKLLSADLEAGFRVVRLDGKFFIRSRGRWRAGRLDNSNAAASDWTRGKIISRNYGRVIVPPYEQNGTLVPGYTRNGPGEGASEIRKTPVELICKNRPVGDTNLSWLHDYHAWDLEQMYSE